MALPLYNPRIVAQGLARLTSAYATKYNVRNWLAALLQPLQDIEDASWQVLGARFLASAPTYTLPETNTVFDSIGALVGQGRDGYDDADYKSLIYLRIAVNRATGRTTDWSKIAGILLQTATGPVGYYDANPNGGQPDIAPQMAGSASFCLTIFGMALNPNLVAGILGYAVPNGTRGVFSYSTWPTGNDALWSSVYSPTSGQGVWGSYYQSGLGGLPLAAQEMTRS